MRRRNRSKRKINDMSDYPRMVVSRSLKNIQAQIIDDFTGKTLVSVTSSDKSIRADIGKAKGKTEQSKLLEPQSQRKPKKRKLNRFGLIEMVTLIQVVFVQWRMRLEKLD